VTAQDLSSVRLSANAPSDIAGRFDFNRDGRVNALDLGIVKSNLNRTLAPATAAAALRPATFDSPFLVAPLAGEATIRRVWQDPETSPLR
jgi:hypothetical protein